MKVKIEIDCNNAAFDGDTEAELARILTDLARRIAAGNVRCIEAVYDYNGNKVGTVTVTG